jgi:hypothetical protein
MAASWPCCRQLGRLSAKGGFLGGDEGDFDAKLECKPLDGGVAWSPSCSSPLGSSPSTREGPPPTAPIGTLVDEIVLKRGRIVVGSVVGMVGALILIWFTSTLRGRLAREGDAGSLIGFAAYGAGLVTTVGALAHGSFRLAMTTVHDRDVLSEAMRPLAILGTHVIDALFWGMIGLVVAMSVGAFAAQLLPRVMAVVGVVLSVGVVAVAPTDHGAAGIALLPWLFVACVLFLRREHLFPASDAP